MIMMICQIVTIAPQSTRERIQYQYITHGPKIEPGAIVGHWRPFSPNEKRAVSEETPGPPAMFALRTTYPIPHQNARKAAIVQSARIAVCPPSREGGENRTRVFMPLPFHWLA